MKRSTGARLATDAGHRKRRGANPAGNDSKVRIILAAEALFAAGGIDGVSLREIAVKAGQGNHFAVQYHFGSREGLVQAIFLHRMQQMEETRAEMLAQAEAKGALGDVRTLLEIVYLPQLELKDQGGPHAYANFLFQYLQRIKPDFFGDFGGELPPHIARTLSLLRGQIDFLPMAAAQRRQMTANFMFLNILVTHDNPAPDDGARESLWAAIDDTLDQIVAALCLPPRQRG
jgi:AcrR family transcriptional regulator